CYLCNLFSIMNIKIQDDFLMLLMKPLIIRTIVCFYNFLCQRFKFFIASCFCWFLLFCYLSLLCDIRCIFFFFFLFYCFYFFIFSLSYVSNSLKPFGFVGFFFFYRECFFEALGVFFFSSLPFKVSIC